MRWIFSLILLLGLALASPAAGTIIRNQAVARVAGETYLSNVVETVVQAVCVPSISPNGTLTDPSQRAVISAGGFAYFSYILTNNGNNPFNFALSTEFQGATWAFGANDIRFFKDINGNAQRDPGEPEISQIVVQPAEEVRIVLEIKAPDSALGQINLTPVATCPDGKADRDNNSQITIGAGPALSLEKSVDPKTVLPGQEVRFTLRLRNNGNGRSNGPIYVTDALNTPDLADFRFVAGSASTPKGTIEYSSDGLNWGASISPVRYIRLVSPGLSAGEETFLVFSLQALDTATSGTRKNIAYAEGPGGPARAEQEFKVLPNMGHFLGPIGNPRALTGGEGSANDRQHAYAVVGQTACFDQTLENSGTAADNYLLRTGSLPQGVSAVFQTQAGTPLPSPVYLAAGQQINFKVCLTLSPQLPLSASPISFAVIARSSAGVENLTYDDLDLLDPSLIHLTKTQSVSSRIEASGSITYTLTVENTLPIPLNNVIVEDTLDSHLEFVSGSDSPTVFNRTAGTVSQTVVQWPFSQLAAGEKRTLSLRVRVNKETPEGTKIQNAFSLRSSETPVSQVSNTVSVPVESINLLVLKTVNPQKANWGDVLTYTLSVSNPFTNPMVVRVVDTPPDSLEYVAGSSSLGEPVQQNGHLEWSNIPLNPNESVTFTYKMRVKAGSTGDLVNKAQAFTTSTSSGSAVASSVASAAVKLDSGVFTPPRALIGRVFLDPDRDGRFTPGLDIPLPGARVVLANGLQALTDVQGRYSFRNPPGGIWEIFLDPASAPFLPLPHPEAIGDRYRHRVRIEGLTVSDFPLEMPLGYSKEQRSTVLEFGPLSVTKSLMALPNGIRVILHLTTTQPLPQFELTDPLPNGASKVFTFDPLIGDQTLTYDLPEGYLTDPQARWRYP